MTLVEVLISSVLLGLVVMTSLTALSASYAVTNHARMVTLAGQVAQSVMEDMRLKNYTDIAAYAAQNQPVTLTTNLASERFSTAFSTSFTSGMTVSGSFTTLVASSSGQLGKISLTVTVAWTERKVAYTRSLTTYFSEKGLSDYLYVGW